MATSEIVIDGIGPVKVFRRKGLKYIRISIGSDGTVRLSIPWYVSRAAGVRYLHSKSDWIKKHSRDRKIRPWYDGQKLTRDHVLRLRQTDGRLTRQKVQAGALEVYLPITLENTKRQLSISKNIKKFLIDEGRRLLIPMVYEVAARESAKVKDVRIKLLKSRWGSCSHDKVISLNASLLRLPQDLVEYVIVHEVAHTKHLNHGNRFWTEVEKALPDYKLRRKALRQHNPAMIP